MSIEISQFNLNAGLLQQHQNIIHHSFWHEIVVENVKGLDRDAVLRPLMKCCQPFDFIPARFTLTGNKANFLLKNCGIAIEKLCSQGLIITNPHDKDKPFKITIKLCYASGNNVQINVQANLMAVLNKRFNNTTGLLNLDNFAKDADLEEYCPLSQSKLFSYVLHLAKNLQFKILKLSNNDIASLKAMEALENFKTPICVDLRNNNIKDIIEIENIKQLNITELLLDGNPICDNFDATNYGKVMKELLTKLEKLDGFNIQSKGSLPFRRNFLCNYSGFDLVDQFLEHYFTLYDAKKRSVLEEVYHKDALFSLSSTYIPSQSTSATAKLSTYKQVSRNLKNLSDFSKNTQNLYAGRAEIIKLLSSLPPTEHDPYSFTADLIMYTKKTAILIVTGVFRECSESLAEPGALFGFSRTFILLAGQHGQYSIVNEMLSITNATSNRAAGAFKYPRVSKLVSIPAPKNSKERSELTDTLTVITGMKTEWSYKCLEECKYDLKEALSLFVELHKKDKIPKSAFHNEQEKIEFKNRRKITNSPTPLTPSYPSPVDKQSTPVASPNKSTQSSGQPPLAPGDLKAVVEKLNTQYRPWSPDHIWNKYSGEEKSDQSENEVMEVVDLVDSSEEGSGSEPESLGSKNNKKEVNNKTLTPAPTSNNDETHKKLMGEQCHSQEISVENRNGQNDTKTVANVPTVLTRFQKELTKIETPNLLPRKAMRRLRKNPKKQVKLANIERFQPEFFALQRAYYQQGFQNVLETSLNMISRYSTFYEAFEAIITWLYQTNTTHARVFCNRLLAMSTYTTPFMSDHRIRLIIAICEFKYGDEVWGEQGFRTLMANYHMWTNPVTEFCKGLLEKGQTEKAKHLVQPYLYGNHPLKMRITNIIRSILRKYRVQLV